MISSLTEISWHFYWSISSSFSKNIHGTVYDSQRLRLPGGKKNPPKEDDKSNFTSL
jgi:hypothetical protein